MPKQSAEILAYRRTKGDLEVFLVHPGGPLWAKKDLGAWSIPKGEFGDGEKALAAAKREFAEETGQQVEGTFIALEPVRQSGGKTVHAFAIEADIDASHIRSNSFEMEWPPRSGKRAQFPEVDRAAWFDISAARTKINAGQIPLLDALSTKLRSE